VVFRIATMRDYVRVTPDEAGRRPLIEIATEQLKQKYEGKVIHNVGYVVLVYDVKVSKRGRVLFGDAATYHRAVFKALTYMPMEGEVVDGVVEDARDIGLFVRIGPIIGFVNKVHIMEDSVFFNREARAFVGEKTKRTVRVGDVVRARIVGVSFIVDRNTKQLALRVTMTMRGLGLGKHEWIAEAAARKRR